MIGWSFWYTFKCPIDFQELASIYFFQVVNKRDQNQANNKVPQLKIRISSKPEVNGTSSVDHTFHVLKSAGTFRPFILFSSINFKRKKKTLLDHKLKSDKIIKSKFPLLFWCSCHIFTFMRQYLHLIDAYYRTCLGFGQKCPADYDKIWCRKWWTEWKMPLRK